MTETVRTETTNFYDTFGLERDSGVENIRETLRTLRLNWGAKATRAGVTGEQARGMLALIERANLVFADEDTRERYDLSLRKAAETEAPADIDWIGRAWNYYWGEDDGAADVCARLAREKAPSDARAQVVSAWISLRQDNGLETARRYADEAFVMGELGDDASDILHVRGAVLLSLGLAVLADPNRPDHDANRHFDRAIQNLERAVAVAGDAEKPVIFWRLSLTHARKQDWDRAFDAARQGLTVQADITTELEQLLNHQIATVVVAGCQRENHEQTLALYRSRAGQVEDSGMRTASKSLLLALIGSNIARLEKLLELLKRIRNLRSTISRLEAKRPPAGSPAPIPFVSMLIAVVTLMIALATAPAAGLVTVVMGVYAGYRIWKRSIWMSDRKEYDQSQIELADANRQLQQTADACPTLRQPLSLTTD